MKIARNALTITAVAVMASFTMSLSAATKTWSVGGDGKKCAYGTWGSSSSGAQHTSSMLTGVGIITIRPKGMTLLLF